MPQTARHRRNGTKVIKKNEKRWWIVKTTKKAVASAIVTAWDISYVTNVNGESRKKIEDNESIYQWKDWRGGSE